MRQKLPRKPRLKQSATVRAFGDDTLFVLDEDTATVFEGAIFVDLAPLLDGARTVPELLAAVGDRYALTHFYRALGYMAAKQVLADGPTSNAFAAFYDRYDATSNADAAEHRRVALTVLGALDPTHLQERLQAHHLDVDDQAALRVVVVDDYLHADLESINAAQHERGQPWLLARPGGQVLWMGPLVRPGHSACWQCLAQRLRANREVARYTAQYATPVRTRQRQVPPSPGSLQAGVNLVAIEVAKALVVGASHSLENKLLTLDLTSLESVEHTVVKRPQCPTCGTIEVIEATPIALRSSPKVHSPMSGHRSALPEQTFADYRHHISPITGVITNLTRRPDTSSGLVNNFTAGHYFPILSDDLSQVQQNRYSRGGASGRTVASAKTATLCECLERYSTIFFGDRKRIQATREHLGDSAYDLRQLQLFSDAQYAMRQQASRDAIKPNHRIPDPPDDSARCSWATAWSLTHQRFVHLPATYCFYGFQEPDSRNTCDSNGVAAGTTLEEAILSGLLELIERDAVALWWYNRCRRPAVDMASFDLPYWHKIERYYREDLGRELHVLDLRTDTQVPVFVVVSRRTDAAAEDILLGYGAHTDPAFAIMRALSDSQQYLPALAQRDGQGKTRYRFVDPDKRAWFETATYRDHPYLVPDPSMPARTRDQLPSMASDDIRDDLVRCIDVLRDIDLDVLAMDLTRPDVGLPVARVAVPGLRHFWRRMAPGRLYDVPVKLGWLDRAHTESEMNPRWCFV